MNYLLWWMKHIFIGIFSRFVVTTAGSPRSDISVIIPSAAANDIIEMEYALLNSTGIINLQ